MRQSSLVNFEGTEAVAIAIDREIDSKYDNIKLVADSIATVDIVADNMPLLHEVRTALPDMVAISNDIMPNLAEILQADTNAATATTMAATATAQAGLADTARVAAEVAQSAAEAKAVEAALSAAAADTSADLAAADAVVATTQAGVATTQAGIATTKAAEAAASAASAATKASEADASAIVAAARAQEAENDAEAANISASLADDSELLASQWATQTHAEVVPGLGYGAKKYAQDAAASAVSAATSESNAAGSATAAAEHATTATTQAGVATTKAGEASTSAANAAASESNALTYSVTAVTQAGIAQTQANIATAKVNEIQAITAQAVTGPVDADYDSQTGVLTFSIPQGVQGIPGPAGTSIVSVVRTSGTGAAGTTDTYTITFSDASTSTFTVHNGADGMGSGDMLKATYDTTNNGKVDVAELAESVAWSNVSGTPATYPPSAHNHDSVYEAKNSNIQAHISSVSNPHGVTKAQIGLANVDNTADVDKPVSTAQSTAIGLKLDKSVADASFIGRADKYLAAQNIANMLYTSGKLTKVRYVADVDNDYEVLTYTDSKLTNVAHYVTGMLMGNTTLSYTGGVLTSAVYIGA